MFKKYGDIHLITKLTELQKHCCQHPTDFAALLELSILTKKYAEELNRQQELELRLIGG